MSLQPANKSKVVFAIISQGNCIYTAMTRIAVASLRARNPSLHLVVACDHQTDIAIRRTGNPLIGEVDEWVVAYTPPGNAGFRNRFIKTSLRSLIEGPFLFLDSDIFVCGDLSGIFTLNADIAGARNRSSVKFNEQVAVQDFTMLVAMGWKLGTEVYVNAGVLYYNDTPGAYRFADEWHRRWMQSFARFEDHRDQPAMHFALHETQPRLAVLPDRFNAQFKFTPGVASGAAIWHYYASLNKPPHTPFEQLANDLMHGFTLDKGEIAAMAASKHPWRRDTIIDDWCASIIIRRGHFNGWEAAWLRRETIRYILRYLRDIANRIQRLVLTLITSSLWILRRK